VERLQVHHHSAVGQVDRLEAQNLVARRGAESDRRQVYVTVTPRGLTLQEQLSTVHRAELHRIGPQINQLLTQLGTSVESESLAGQ
jgi:DNA-binding MarR family transcriptional regulator